MTKSPYLDGQLLIAMPGMSDPRFDRSVIYVCAHSEQGAMGIIINKTAPMMRFGDLLSQIDITGDEGAIEPPQELLEMPVLFGGPVEQGRGFVLHTSDYFTADSSLPVAENIALTATVDILRAMAKGEGPQRAVLALGYAGWAPGQLENEIQLNGWLTCQADEELVFGLDFDERYGAALRKLKIDPAMLSSDAGHA
ncbi:YqgE/AlgH family protein [Aestuariivirga sp.]|uniref:YqgE/AlgH family protein n=1 Tax=Aestuariivirga sp. TaxID=2650926 RepID=UPI00391B51FA